MFQPAIVVVALPVRPESRLPKFKLVFPGPRGICRLQPQPIDLAQGRPD